MNRLFGILFILTGIFAIAGGLYTWGDGNIFDQNELVKVLIPWADIFLTGPVSIIAGLAVLKNKSWGQTLGLATSGIYVFGSALVFISIFWNNDYSVFLIIPALSGLFIGVAFITLALKREMDKI
ncbi:MAG: hypothetical protein IPO32_14205 [Crocinitomicaceae bacterium]|nr:hypothetical protein [Crocinitomicaceae bacterium]MBK9592591.1 hypothetical protein [Crocinitomicaceae bacterium]